MEKEKNLEKLQQPEPKKNNKTKMLCMLVMYGNK